MSTYRERREARIERLEGWAEGRAAKAEEAFRASDLREEVSGIPFGQPILAGHHSQRRHQRVVERAQAAANRGLEHADMAERHASRAANIQRQLDRSIYSDDHDAVERLAEKLAALEAERDRVKAYNASCRKAAKTGGTGDTSLLDDAQRADLATSIRVTPYAIGKGGAMPAYVLTNLSGNITRTRKRLEALS